MSSIREQVKPGKRSRILAFILGFWAPWQSHALIDPGYLNGAGESSELFISIIDETNKQYYFKDLGITMEALKAGQDCIDSNLEKDKKFLSFLKTHNETPSPVEPLVYTIAGVYPFKDDGSNRNTWGYVATSDAGEDIFDNATTFVAADVKLLQSYIAKLNGTVTSTLVSENFSQIIPSDSNAYHGDPDNIPGFRGGQTDSGLDESVGFYFVHGGKPKGTTDLIGNWTLSSAGVLSYVPVNGSAYPICPPSDTGGEPPPDDEEPPPDDGGGDTPPPSDTPPGTDEPAAELPQKRVLNPRSAGILLFAGDSTLRVGRKSLILIRSNLINGNRRLKLGYSVTNGEKWRSIGNTTIRKGKYIWRPKPKDIAENGILRACVRSSGICDQITVKVAE